MFEDCFSRTVGLKLNAIVFHFEKGNRDSGFVVSMECERLKKEG